MTETSSNDIGRKIPTQKDEEQNYFKIEEIDEIENPLELDYGDLNDYDVSMEATNDLEDSSEDENSVLPSLPPYNRTMKIIRYSWNYAETKEMLKMFMENKRYIDRLMKVKSRYNFIAKKLSDLNPDQPVSAYGIENKIKALIRTYRANRGCKGMAKTDIDCDLEKIFGIDRLMKGVNVKSKLFQNRFHKSSDYNPNNHFGVGESIKPGNTSLLSTATEPNVLGKIRILKNTESSTRAYRLQYQAQATQTDLGDGMLKQLVQIEKNQQKRWDEEKVLISRIERAKAERFTRKESLLQDLINVLKPRIQ